MSFPQLPTALLLAVVGVLPSCRQFSHNGTSACANCRHDFVAEPSAADGSDDETGASPEVEPAVASLPEKADWRPAVQQTGAQVGAPEKQRSKSADEANPLGTGANRGNGEAVTPFPLLAPVQNERAKATYGPDESVAERTQDVSAPDGAIGLAALEQMALQHNPTLNQAAWSVNKASGIRRQVGRYPNPTLGYQGQEIGDDGTAGIQGGFVRQTIIGGDKLRLNQNVLDHEVQALSWTAETQRQKVLTDLQINFYDALGAQRRMQLAAELERVAEEGVKTAVELKEALQGAKPDVLQAEIQLAEVWIIRQNAQIEYETAWQQLAGIVGQPQMPARRLEGDLDADVPELNLNSAYQQLLESSPELQVAQARVNRALANRRRQEAQPIPNLLTQLAVSHDYASGDDVVNVQLGVPLPVFNRNRGNIDAAHAEYHRAWENVERLRLALRVRLNDAFNQYRQARNRVNRIQGDILPRAAENRELTEEAYRLGEFGFLRVLTARRTYFEANLRYVQALAELQKSAALIDGLLLTGGLDAPADTQMNDDLRGQALNGR